MAPDRWLLAPLPRSVSWRTGVQHLIKAFTDAIIDPLMNRGRGRHGIGLGVQLGTEGNAKTFLDIGAVLSAVISFVVFMAVVYFLIVVPTIFPSQLPSATTAAPIRQLRSHPEFNSRPARTDLVRDR